MWQERIIIDVPNGDRSQAPPEDQEPPLEVDVPVRPRM
jgi:hypothetical protein